MLIPASPEAAAALPEIDPLLAWGVLTRGLGVVYAIAFASIAVQIRGLAGRDGMSPFAPMMQQMAHDFPGWRRLLYFPTLLWLTGGGDAALVGLPVAGVGFGLAAAYGGAASPLALAACWATLRSLDLPVGLLYPWDSLLLEAGALATLLPPLPPLTLAVAAAAAPHPWVGFAFRWLLFRLMVGFGKKKSKEDNGTKHDECCDDLGLIAPGQRDISIKHGFEFYNYSEIEMLWSNKAYRFEKSPKHDDLNLKEHAD